MGLVPIIAAGLTFVCTPTHVWDGDGPIWCAEGPRIRLAGIAAREIDESCRTNQPCPEKSGKDARDHLVKILGGSRGKTREGHVLVSGPRLHCVSEGSAGGNRTAAWCRIGRSGDLSCMMVATGHAQKWPRYWRSKQCP